MARYWAHDVGGERGSRRRAVAAYNRRDLDAFVGEFDPEVEWHSLVQATFGGEQSVYRRHLGLREGLREMDEALGDLHIEYSEIRDLGERIVVLGRARGRGRLSGAESRRQSAGWWSSEAVGRYG